jgi:hypothetical protein
MIDISMNDCTAADLICQPALAAGPPYRISTRSVKVHVGWQIAIDDAEFLAREG